jgi:hypothetical protein
MLWSAFAVHLLRFIMQQTGMNARASCNCNVHRRTQGYILLFLSRASGRPIFNESGRSAALKINCIHLPVI